MDTMPAETAEQLRCLGLQVAEIITQPAESYGYEFTRTLRAVAIGQAALLEVLRAEPDEQFTQGGLAGEVMSQWGEHPSIKPRNRNDRFSISLALAQKDTLSIGSSILFHKGVLTFGANRSVIISPESTGFDPIKEYDQKYGFN